MTDVEIRESRSADHAAIERFYPAAFPEEDLVPLLRALLSDASAPLSLVALGEGEVVGHAVFTNCQAFTPEGMASPAKLGLLGPLAVTPAWQRRGIGSALVRDGLRRLAARGCAAVYVLGDPAYYQRFGFGTETDVAPPYTLTAGWREAWRSLALPPDPSPLRGRLQPPGVWMRPEYWGP